MDAANFGLDDFAFPGVGAFDLDGFALPTAAPVPEAPIRIRAGRDAVCRDCCRGPAPPPVVGPIVCDTLTDLVCVTLSCPTCANLDGMSRTLVRELGGLCQVRSYADGLLLPGDGDCPTGFFGAEFWDLYCGCAAPPCPDPISFPNCAYVGVSGSNFCDPFAVSGARGRWRLATTFNDIADDGRLPVTWVHADPPVGVAHGFVVPIMAGDAVVHDCDCPCPPGTRVDLLITAGAC